MSERIPSLANLNEAELRAHLEKFVQFARAVSKQVISVGVEFGARVPDAKKVQEELFEKTNGDATAVTDEMVRKEYERFFS